MAESPLYFKQIEIGPMQNFTYLIGDPVSHEALVIDAAWDIPAIVQVAERDGYNITKALVTHYHQDHLGGDFSGYHIPGATELLEQVKAKVYIHKAEAPFLSRVAGLSSTDIVQVESGDTTNVGNLQITFIHTPGHTPGSQCFLLQNRLVAGDTFLSIPAAASIFREAVPRICTTACKNLPTYRMIPSCIPGTIMGIDPSLNSPIKSVTTCIYISAARPYRTF